MAELSDADLRDIVRERYAAAAKRIAERDSGCGCASPAPLLLLLCRRRPAHHRRRRRRGLRRRPLRRRGGRRPTASVEASLGCGVPTAVADLHEGETVLDLGSGAGADVLSAPGASAPPAARSAWT